MAIVADLPNDADVLDLNAARVARAEVRAAEGKGSLFLKLSAGYVEVVPEVPLDAALKFQGEDLKGGLGMLLADPADAEILFNEGLTASDLKEIVEFVSGKSLGE